MSIVKLIFGIYDNIININNNEITIIFDKSNNIWFCLPQLLKALQYSTYRDVIKSILKIVDEKDISTFKEIYDSTTKNYENNKIQPHTKMINEGGLYLLLSSSRKPLAIELKKELYSKILPEIRKNGIYKINSNDKKEVNKLTKKLKLLSNERIRTQKHSYSNTTGKGFIYILEIKTSHAGSNKTCYKIGYTSNLEKRMTTYKTGNPDVKLVYHENINCNKKQLEKCVMNLNYLKLLKNKTEVICDIPLNKLKAEFEDCRKLLSKYI